jgi:hypothetical protein
LNVNFLFKLSTQKAHNMVRLEFKFEISCLNGQTQLQHKTRQEGKDQAIRMGATKKISKYWKAGVHGPPRPRQGMGQCPIRGARRASGKKISF